jgi:hypothetical protein
MAMENLNKGYSELRYSKMDALSYEYSELSVSDGTADVVDVVYVNK